MQRLLRGNPVSLSREGLSLKTQQEMRAGFIVNQSSQDCQRADSGERMLRKLFGEKSYEFHTAVAHNDNPMKPGKITLTVYAVTKFVPPGSVNEAETPKELFSIVEDADEFVSQETLTKIMLVVG